MPDVTTPDRPTLVAIPNVEILQAGENWPASTGPFTVTADDLAAAVAAQDDPAIRAGIIRLGHTDRLMDSAEPSVGRLDNLRTTNEGMTLVADLVGVPSWLAEIINSAYPSRSVDACQNYRTAQGRTHALVIEGLALLGVTAPAVDTLADVAALYGIAAAEGPNDGAGTRVRIDVMPTRVAAQVSTDDVRRAYYDTLEGPMQWWWIRELNLDPTELIVDDDEGHLWRVPFTVSGEEVSFGEPSEVRITYVAASEAPTRPQVTIFASRTDSRPPGGDVDLSALRTRLGLADDTSDEDVLAAAAQALPDPAAASDTPPPPAGAVGGSAAGETAETPPPPAESRPGVPEGAVLIDAAALEQLQADAAQGVAAARRQAREDEDRFIGSVRAQGRLGSRTNPASQRLEASLRRVWQRNPGEAAAVAASLAVTVPTVAAGHEMGAESDITDEGWTPAELGAFPELRTTGGN